MMKSRMVKRGVLGFLLILMFVGAGFFYSSAAQGQEKEIVWAIIDDFSGPFAASTDEGYKATVMWLEEHHYKMGPYKVKLITRDTELKPAVGVRRLQEVLSEFKPLVAIAAQSSAVVLSMEDIIGKTKGTIFWAEGWSTRITGLNGNRYSFRWHSPNYTIARASLAGFLDKFPEVKKVVRLYMDYAWGYDMAEQSEAILKERGIQTLKVQWIPVTATDTSVFMTEANSLKPDAYLLGLYGKLYGVALRQAHEFGLKEKMKVFTNAATQNMLRGIGSETLQGMYLADHWNIAMPNEWTKSFSQKFFKKYKVYPGDTGASNYHICEIMERVITETGSNDPKVLIPALEKLGTFDGPDGKETMSSWNHQIEHDYLLLRGKAPSEKKFAEDYVEVIGKGRIYPKRGEKEFEFDRTKESL
jgi:branched-chain amino acid transport system substrate-binding protein